VPRSTGMCESGHVIEARFSAGVWSVSSSEWGFLRLPRLAGVTLARYLTVGREHSMKNVTTTNN
jgi:hypothetical protein